MSIWKDIKKEDIELDGDEINICIGSDNQGNNYVVVKVDDMKAIINNYTQKI